jgi:hypothetical protein
MVIIRSAVNIMIIRAIFASILIIGFLDNISVQVIINDSPMVVVAVEAGCLFDIAVLIKELL